jgi:hypothetical protein
MNWIVKFYIGYPPDLPSIQELSRTTTQHLEQHEVYRPIVHIGTGRVDWDYSTLTMS